MSVALPAKLLYFLATTLILLFGLQLAAAVVSEFAPSYLAGRVLYPVFLGRDPISIVAPWQVTFRPAVGEAFSRRGAQLFDLSLATDDPAVAGFGGTATYRADFEWSDETQTTLSLGTVHGVSTVRKSSH